MVVAVHYRGPSLQLPWSVSIGEDRRFQRMLCWFFGAFLLLAVIVPMIPVPELAREEQEKLPEQLARLLLEEQVIPEPVIEKPEPPKVVEEIPPEIVETRPPEPKPAEEPKIVESKPEPEVAPAQLAEEARQRAAVSGLMQFRDDLQSMRDMVDVEAISTADLRRAESAATEVKRDLIASKATAKSGGVQVDEVSIDAGGVALSGKENTMVDSSLSLPGGSGTQAVYREELDDGSDGLPYRSEEEMRRVMDANKSAIFAVYNRALRSDPTLEGKLMVSMTIEASGFISLVTLISSQLDDTELEEKLLTRIKLIQFPAGEYALTTLNQTFDFLPY